MTPAERADWLEAMNARAQESFRLGQEAMEEGRFADAAFWLGRAERMARESPNVTWSLALALLNLGRIEGCLERMRVLRERFALREAAFLEAVCLGRLNRKDEAAARLGAALSRFPVLPETRDLAGRLARHAGLAGWCSASNAGFVEVAAEGAVRILLDGRDIASGSGRHALPEGWACARRLEVRGERARHLLGSPVDLPALTRCESLVKATADGLEGWLWHPAEPDFVPTLRLWDGSARAVPDFAPDVDSDVPLSRPRAFRIPAKALPPGDCGLLDLRDGFGRRLTGAPIDPAVGRLVGGKVKGLPGRLAPLPVGTGRVRPVRRHESRGASPGCAVIVPVYRDRAGTLTCLKSVLATLPAGFGTSGGEVIVVDDATPEPSLARALDRLARERRITLLRHAVNRGFPAAVNTGLRQAAGRDVILLNSDTLVFPGWIERLLRPLARGDVGTVTPLSNDASILSYPSVTRANPVPSPAGARALDRLAARLFAGFPAIDLPTGNGFCMAVSAECLAETGPMREDLFAQGYGEENDFCLRASARGWRHVAAADVYVAHRGSASFGSARKALMARNLEILNALHPGYDALVAAFIDADPLAPARREMDLARLERRRARRKAVLMIQHDAGGGVGRVVRERAAAAEAEGAFALALRPTARGCLLVPLDDAESFPNLRFDLPGELPLLCAALKRLGAARIEWHHLVGHAPCVRELHAALGVTLDIFVHDHVWFCPRISLLDGNGRYCGEPDVSGCQACVDRWGSFLGEEIPVSRLVARSGREFAQARRLMVPSHDTARRMARHFPAFRFEPVPLEDDRLLTESPAVPYTGGRKLRVCVVGGISRWKGYDVLLALARRAREEALPVEFVLVGHTPDDDALFAAGVRVSGEYREEEGEALVRAQEADIGFVPSVAPETWCYALGLLWRCGLQVVCFDLGAQAERVRATGRGAVLPLGAPADFILSFLARLLTAPLRFARKQ